VQVTLQQVAEQAGVSPSTVSRVLNNASMRVGLDTQERIRTIASEMGYRANGAARALATGKTNSIALWADNVLSTYYSQMIYLLRAEAENRGYDLMIGQADVQEDGSLNSAKLMSWPLDGVLTIDLPRAEIPGLKQSLVWGKPLLNIGAYVHGDADFVKVDFVPGVIDAVLQLSSRGCKRIAYLLPDWLDWFEEINDGRFQGYNLGVEQLGMKPEYIFAPNESRLGTLSALEDYVRLNGCPDGIFCFNDDMAIGAHRVIRSLGLRIPEDVALVGCNGIEDTDYLYPPLSTVVQPMEEMSRTAWTFLERRINEPGLPLQQETLQATLMVRGSSLG